MLQEPSSIRTQVDVTELTASSTSYGVHEILCVKILKGVGTVPQLGMTEHVLSRWIRSLEIMTLLKRQSDIKT
jgi:hypothetical protein